MKNILCIGGAGQLGHKVVSIFSKHNVVNIDFRPHPQAHSNLLLDSQLSTADNHRNILDSLKGYPQIFNAILVTAGGWAGGSIKDNDYFTKVKNMSECNLYPSILAAHLATKYLTPHGLIAFTGAAAVYKEPQPEMLGYSIAKSGVHYLATTLAQKAKDYNLRVVTILPETIDTASNRQAMPKADFNTWAKPEHIGEMLLGWVEGLNVPANGSFVLLKVKNGSIQPEYI